MTDDRSFLTRYAWLSVGAAVVVIALKVVAYLMTQSVGLLSDAIESLVNLAGAGMALWMLHVAARPPDTEFNFGYSKAEYFSSAVEGALIVAAAGSIAYAAILRLVHPAPLESAGVGIAISAVATAINFVVARVLMKAGREHRSITLEADARHLDTDVLTSVGVLVGVAAVALTGWERLDPIVALLVAANIVRTGGSIVRRSVGGLLDSALPADEQRKVDDILDRYRSEGVAFHALRSRVAGPRRFLTMHVLVPGAWTVQRGHELVERVERDIEAALGDAAIITHLEPIEDPASYDDVALAPPRSASKPGAEP
jgi:cation diffusion facilitator family transporter